MLPLAALTIAMWVAILFTVFIGAGGVLFAYHYEQRSRDRDEE